MKIIISYASAGSGHFRAALAIYHCLKEIRPGLNILLADNLKYANPLFAKIYTLGYTILVTRFKFAWAVAFWITSVKFFCCILNLICRLNCRKFINFLLEEQPDIIFTTHFLPAGIVDYLKQKGKIDSRLLTVITDFGLHPLWVLKNCGDYFVASEYTRNCLIRRGVGPENIKVSGIPIDSSFSTGTPPFLHRSASSGKERAGLTVLLVTGSFGFALIEKAVKALYSRVNILAVCGKNQRLYDKLKRKRYPGVDLFGFTEDMHALMSRSDIIITKPGGLTIAEALAMQLPMVFIGGIPGQETENARILEDCGCAINAKDLKSLKGLIIDLKRNPEKLCLMRDNIRKIRKPDATGDICRYVCSGSV
ncbi:MAG: glycosyltransferase [Candidatus Omnitrophota bacterium]